MYKRSLYTVNNAGQRPKRYLRYTDIQCLHIALLTFRFIIRKRNKYRSEQSCSVYSNVMCVKCQVKFYVHSTSKDDINNQNSKQYLSFMCCPAICLNRLICQHSFEFLQYIFNVYWPEIMLLEKGFYECVCAVKEVKSVTDVKKKSFVRYMYIWIIVFICV